jgi:hypothetical protein
MPGAAPPSGLSSLAIPTNAQPRAISRSLVIRTRAALALSSSDTALAQPTRTSTINHTEKISLVLIALIFGDSPQRRPSRARCNRPRRRTHATALRCLQ